MGFILSGGLMLRICGFFASFKYGIHAWELKEKASGFSLSFWESIDFFKMTFNQQTFQIRTSQVGQNWSRLSITIDTNRSRLPARMPFALKLALSVENNQG